MNDLAEQLRHVLDGRWEQVRQQMRQHLSQDGGLERLAPPTTDLSMEEYRARVLDQLRFVAALPHAAGGLSVEQGGTGEYGASITAFEMLGHADLSLFVKAGVQFGLFGGAIANLGTKRHHDAYLADMLSTKLLGCFAMTETGHGSDVQSLRTTATYDPATDELVVHSPSVTARKDYIGGAARDARLAAVFAQLVVDGQSHGVHCVLVPIRDGEGRPLPGVTIGDCGAKAGLPGVDNGRLSFDHVSVPRTNLLNRYGDIDEHGIYTSPIENPTRRFFTMLGTLVRGRISVAAGAGAATRSALTLAVGYAGHRRQFTAPGTEAEVVLLNYLTHQRKLLPALARTYALQFAQNELIEAMDGVFVAGDGAPEHLQRELEGRAAGIKAVATAHATRAIQVCREACGGAGYLAVNRLPALKADTDVFTTFEGDNTVLLQLVAKGLLTDYRDTFGDLDTLALVRFGARQLAGSVIERTVAGTLIGRLIARSPGRDPAAVLAHRGGQLGFFEDRERHMIEGLGRRMRKAAKANGAGAFDVVNSVQDHLVAVAEAHVDRIVLEAFVAGIARCEDGPARALLEKVCDLYALATIEEHRAWHLEHGRMTPTQAKSVTASVNQLCTDLRPHAQTLVDAFGIPEEWLASELLEPAPGELATSS